MQTPICTPTHNLLAILKQIFDYREIVPISLKRMFTGLYTTTKGPTYHRRPRYCTSVCCGETTSSGEERKS